MSQKQLKNEDQNDIQKKVYKYWEKQMQEIAPMLQNLEPAPKPKLKKVKHKKRFVENNFE